MQQPQFTISKQLTLENFWNEMMQKYPLATKQFCEWIDQYKAATMWREIYGNFIKFHHLTYDMQLGIWLKYVLIQDNEESLVENLFTGEWNYIDDLSKIIEHFLDRREELLAEEAETEAKREQHNVNKKKE